MRQIKLLLLLKTDMGLHRQKDKPGPFLIKTEAWGYLLLVIVVFGSLAVLSMLTPVAQDLNYHAFADSRVVLGIPNFLNVVSNLPFLLVGVLGLRYCLESGAAPLRPAWIVLFIGVALVSVGSAYYHWNPQNNSLVWDRLPMTLGFMSLFAALIGEFLDQRLGRLLLWPAILVGLGSVAHWHFTDDLRLYIWVQFVPFLVLLIVILLFKSNYSHSGMLVIALGFYVLAKLAEALDGMLLNATAGIVSGHTMKHLLAALGAYIIYLMLRRRQYQPEGGP